MRNTGLLILAMLVASTAFGQANRSSSASDSNNDFPCAVDARWTNSNGNVPYARGSSVPVSLSLLVHVGKSSKCSTADVSVTATYLTDLQEFICAGTIPASAPPTMTLSSTVQTFNLEFRPFTQSDFMRWRNPPNVRGLQQGKRLVCMNVDGTAEVLDSDRLKASWVRLSVAVLPPGGGVAIAEAIVHISQ